MVETKETLTSANEESEVVDSTREELGGLREKIGLDRDKKKFDKLIRDTDFNNGLQKIYKKGLENRIKNFERNYNKYSHKRVDDYTAYMIKTHPELIPFIRGELDLPVRTDKSKVLYDFSALSFEQKIRFMALYETRHDLGSRYDKVSASEIINKYKSRIENFLTEGLTEDFNKRIKSKSVAGFISTKILKDEYGLTDTESKKIEGYLTLIKKHPEYIGKEQGKVLEAGGWGKYIKIGVGVVVGALALVGIFSIAKCSFEKPTREVIVSGDRTEVVNFQEVYKLVSAETKNTTTRRHFHEEGYEYLDDSTGNVIINTARTIRNRARGAINKLGIEDRDLDISLDTQTSYIFNFENAKCEIEKKDGKGIIRLTVNNPEIKITKSDPKILGSNREFISLEKFDDFDINAVKTLEKEALEVTSTPEYIEWSVRSLGKDILKNFRKRGYAVDGFIVDAKDFEKVIIKYDDGIVEIGLSDLLPPHDPENPPVYLN